MKKSKGRIAAIVLLGLVVLVLGAALIGWSAISLDVDKLENMDQASSVYDNKGNQIALVSGVEKRMNVSLKSVPRDVQNAFLAAEDARFYDHFGIDTWRMSGALVSNLKSGSYGQGASTITQQLIKLTYLSSEKTMARKLTEIVLALKLERTLSKDEILERYLNTVYFGAGAYGIQSAARTYFDIDTDRLTLAQGAALAAIIKSPSNYAPHLNPEKTIERRKMVLSSMVENEFITQEQADMAGATPLNLAKMGEDTASHPWYVDQAMTEAAGALQVDMDELLSGGYQIHTALDEQMQSSAEKLFENAANFPGNAKDGQQVQAAFVAMDPDTGEVLAMIGGREYGVKRGLNRATQIKRQPGSALKPISVYAAAIDQYGYLPVSTIDDTQRDFGNGYSPRNVGGSYHGIVTLRESLARSLNAASVDLLTKMDINSVLRYMKKAGIETDEFDNNLSLALGSMTYGTSPMTLCEAYIPLANEGNASEGHLVRKILNRDGATVYQSTSNEQRVMKPESAYMLTSMLKSAAQWGSAAKLSALGFDVAGKTGTVAQQSGGNRDIWTVAYTPKLVTTVWMGFDLPDSEHTMSDASSGSNQPAALLTAFLKQNKEAVSGERFQIPSTLTEVLLDQRALETKHRPMLASEYTPKSLVLTEVFPSDRVPTEISNVWQPPTRVFDLSGELSTPSSGQLRFTVLQADAVYRLYRVDESAQTLVAELQGEPGDVIRFTDEQSYEKAEYYVIPVHAELLEEGIVLEGKASDSIRIERPFGFSDWIFFQTPEATPEPSPIPIPSEEPLFDDPEEDTWK
ncbi:PBP1A family penicillin-binding protein, partial [Eubacteriales bacterium OttesenSCG-928-N13]|nr:PBP1A family penicillin-binding protein [Eubacteriales bacterium OttesenSCG-928-N13]